jgi:flagellar biosynthesis/type III secretory pathway M-ring protein FliF/YscJ
MENYWVAVLWSLLPTLVISALFFFILRSVIRADRTERREYARIEKEERARRGLPPRNEPPVAAASASAEGDAGDIR